jgi:hypothetical protein
MAFGGAGAVLNILRMGIRPGLRGNVAMSKASLAINDAISPISKKSALATIGKVSGVLGVSGAMGYGYGAATAPYSAQTPTGFMDRPGTMPQTENMTLALNNLNKATSGTGYRNIDAMQPRGHGFYSGRMR